MSGESHLSGLDKQISDQIAELHIETGRPLIVSDADEVLLQFVAGLERYLEANGYWLDLQSFALTGNIKHTQSGDPVPADQVAALLKDFFATQTHTLEAVPAAAESLKTLSSRAQILVLSNLPLAHREARATCLANQDMAYPVIANSGLKGPAVRALAARLEAPVFFLDDIPHNIASVAEAHEASHRIHFIADTRLAGFIDPAADSHFHTSDWPAARAFIEARLTDEGY